MYAAGELDSFFFIHYPEGGLHVRLRLLPRAGRQNAVTDRVYAAHAGSMENSAEPLRLEIFEVPFEPETERYDDIVCRRLGLRLLRLCLL